MNSDGRERGEDPDAGAAELLRRVDAADRLEPPALEGSAPVRDESSDGTWIAPAAWAALTLVLVIVTVTLDPLWSYYGSWFAGLMTALFVIRREKLTAARRRLDSEEEVLLLEIREAKTRQGAESLPGEMDDDRTMLPPGDNAADD